MNRFIFKHGRLVKTEAPICGLMSFQAESLWRAGKPCQQVRLPKTVEVDDEVESSFPNCFYKRRHVANGFQERPIAHCNSINGNDLVDKGAHLGYGRTSVSSQKDELRIRKFFFQRT